MLQGQNSSVWKWALKPIVLLTPENWADTGHVPQASVLLSHPKPWLACGFSSIDILVGPHPSHVGAQFISNQRFYSQTQKPHTINMGLLSRPSSHYPSEKLQALNTLVPR